MMGWEASLKKLGAPAGDLDQASLDRMDDARALVAAGRPAAAIASALYALEIRLKVRICRNLDLPSLPRAFEIHDLEALLLMAGLKSRLDDPGAVNVKRNWDAIIPLSDLINDLRYRPDRSWSISQAETLLNWLEDPHDGVMSWLLILH